MADVAGDAARVKWPNDVLLDGRKLAGILVEARPHEGWAVLGIGLNVAVDPAELPPEVRGLAGTLGRPPDALEATLAELLRALEARLAESGPTRSPRSAPATRCAASRSGGAPGAGTGAGIDDAGSLLVRRPDGRIETLSAGEVHLGTPRAD